MTDYGNAVKAIRRVLSQQRERVEGEMSTLEHSYGTVQTDTEGAVTVLVDGGTEQPAVAAVKVYHGDRVVLRNMRHTLTIVENLTHKASDDSLAQDAMDKATENEALIEEIEGAIGVTEQHEWFDVDGEHVAMVDKDTWELAEDDSFSDASDNKPYHNMLLNSLGMFLRSALTNLVSITRSAIAFFDGQGNAAQNIVARFGVDGALVGKESGSHVRVRPNGISLSSGNDTPYEFKLEHGSYSFADTGTATLYAELIVPNDDEFVTTKNAILQSNYPLRVDVQYEDPDTGEGLVYYVGESEFITEVTSATIGTVSLAHLSAASGGVVLDIDAGQIEDIYDGYMTVDVPGVGMLVREEHQGYSKYILVTEWTTALSAYVASHGEEFTPTLGITLEVKIGEIVVDSTGDTLAMRVAGRGTMPVYRYATLPPASYVPAAPSMVVVEDGGSYLCDGTSLTPLRPTDDVTGVKGDAESSYRTGDVNLAYANLGTCPVAYGGTGATDAATARTNIGAAASSHTHSYLPLSGGTMTGSIIGIGSAYFSKSSAIDSDGSNPASTLYRMTAGAQDKDGVTIGYNEAIFNTSGVISYQMVAHRVINGTDYYNAIALNIDKSGNYTYGITNAANFRSAIGANNAANLTTGTLPDARLSLANNVSCSRNTSNTTAGGGNIYKRGKVAYCAGYISIKGGLSGRPVLLTIPSGYRPASGSEFYGKWNGVAGNELIATNNGNIVTDAPAGAVTWYFTMSWPIA